MLSPRSDAAPADFGWPLAPIGQLLRTGHAELLRRHATAPAAAAEEEGGGGILRAVACWTVTLPPPASDTLSPSPLPSFVSAAAAPAGPADSAPAVTHAPPIATVGDYNRGIASGMLLPWFAHPVHVALPTRARGGGSWTVALPPLASEPVVRYQPAPTLLREADTGEPAAALPCPVVVSSFVLLPTCDCAPDEHLPPVSKRGRLQTPLLDRLRCLLVRPVVVGGTGLWQLPGGAWRQEDDGGGDDPLGSDAVSIRCACRHMAAQTGVDLTPCREWVKFAVLVVANDAAPECKEIRTVWTVTDMWRAAQGWAEKATPSGVHVWSRPPPPADARRSADVVTRPAILVLPPLLDVTAAGELRAGMPAPGFEATLLPWLSTWVVDSTLAPTAVLMMQQLRELLLRNVGHAVALHGAIHRWHRAAADGFLAGGGSVDTVGHKRGRPQPQLHQLWTDAQRFFLPLAHCTACGSTHAGWAALPSLWDLVAAVAHPTDKHAAFTFMRNLTQRPAGMGGGAGADFPMLRLLRCAGVPLGDDALARLARDAANQLFDDGLAGGLRRGHPAVPDAPAPTPTPAPAPMSDSYTGGMNSLLWGSGGGGGGGGSDLPVRPRGPAIPFAGVSMQYGGMGSARGRGRGRGWFRGGWRG